MEKYSNFEKSSFDIQQSEWLRYTLDNSSPTTILDKIADSREMDREVFLEKVGQKILYIFEILGKQQKDEDRLNQCETVYDLSKFIQKFETKVDQSSFTIYSEIIK